MMTQTTESTIRIADNETVDCCHSNTSKMHPTGGLSGKPQIQSPWIEFFDRKQTAQAVIAAEDGSDDRIGSHGNSLASSRVVLSASDGPDTQADHSEK